MNQLKNKVAVVYGNGGVGGAVANAFARSGARVFLAGRTLEKLKAIQDPDISVLDVLDGVAVERHMEDVVQKAGRIDISFNAIGIPQKGIQGIPLTDLSEESFMLPLVTYLKSHFITARAAARRMVQQGSGVILMHTPNASHISPPFVGGMVPAWAAMEGLCRSLSVEYGRQGVRAVCLFTTGIPETVLIDEVWEIQGKAHGTSYEEFHAFMEGMTHRNRLTTLKELAAAAVYAASDDASALTGTTLNLTAGMIS